MPVIRTAFVRLDRWSAAVRDGPHVLRTVQARATSHVGTRSTERVVLVASSPVTRPTVATRRCTLSPAGLALCWGMSALRWWRAAARRLCSALPCSSGRQGSSASCVTPRRMSSRPAAWDVRRRAGGANDRVFGGRAASMSPEVEARRSRTAWTDGCASTQARRLSDSA